MRSDQHMGMTKETQEFLAENEITPPICECCKRPFQLGLEVIGRYTGMFGDVYPLHRHQLVNGETADEFLQADPWSSGPCFFIGLQVRGGSEFLWDQDSIDKV